MSAEAVAFRPRARRRAAAEVVARADARRGYRVFADADRFEAALPCAVVEQMLALGRRARPVEWLGLLVGRVCVDEAGPHVVVCGVVLDEGAEAGPHTVASTPASEAATRTRARALFPEARPLGWVHGHLAHGAVFSEVDRRNQATWGEAHALGVVVDPWSTPHIAVYRGPGSTLLREVAAPTSPRAPAPRPRRRGLSVLAGVLSLFAGFVACACVPLVWRLALTETAAPREVVGKKGLARS